MGCSFLMGGVVAQAAFLCQWKTFSSGPEVPATMGFARSFPCFAFPWIWGTGGTSFRGCTCVHSGRAIPFFAM